MGRSSVGCLRDAAAARRASSRVASAHQDVLRSSYGRSRRFSLRIPRRRPRVAAQHGCRGPGLAVRDVHRPVQRQGRQHRPGDGASASKLGRRLGLLPGQEHQAALRRGDGRPVQPSSAIPRRASPPKPARCSIAKSRTTTAKAKHYEGEKAKIKADGRGLSERVRPAQFPR